jgi:hypothetical protein
MRRVLLTRMRDEVASYALGAASVNPNSTMSHRRGR